MPDVLASEIARDCRVNVRTVYNWANDGKLPGAYKLGGVWRFDGAKVRTWIRSREIMLCPSTDAAKSGGFGSRPGVKESADRLAQELGL